jgi:hypothetical protein
MGFEPTTSSLGSWHSTTELRPQTHLRSLSSLTSRGQEPLPLSHPRFDAASVMAAATASKGALAGRSTRLSVVRATAKTLHCLGSLLLHRAPGRWLRCVRRPDPQRSLHANATLNSSQSIRSARLPPNHHVLTNRASPPIALHSNLSSRNLPRPPSERAITRRIASPIPARLLAAKSRTRPAGCLAAVAAQRRRPISASATRSTSSVSAAKSLRVLA